MLASGMMGYNRSELSASTIRGDLPLIQRIAVCVSNKQSTVLPLRFPPLPHHCLCSDSDSVSAPSPIESATILNPFPRIFYFGSPFPRIFYFGSPRLPASRILDDLRLLSLPHIQHAMEIRRLPLIPAFHSHIDLLHIDIVLIHRIAQERQRRIVLQRGRHLLEPLAHLLAVVADVRVELDHHVVLALHDLPLEVAPRDLAHQLAVLRRDSLGSRERLDDAVENVVAEEDQALHRLVLDRRPLVFEVIPADPMHGQQERIVGVQIGDVPAVHPLLLLLYVEAGHLRQIATHLRGWIVHRQSKLPPRTSRCAARDTRRCPRRSASSSTPSGARRNSLCTTRYTAESKKENAWIGGREHHRHGVQSHELAHVGIREGSGERCEILVEGFQSENRRRRQMALRRNGETGIPPGGTRRAPREWG